MSLRGPALAVLGNVPEASLYDYAALVTALEARFGSAHQAELSRSRRREEGLPQLAEEIERLTRLAYPEAQPAMLELPARDQFIDALPEEEMPWSWNLINSPAAKDRDLSGPRGLSPQGRMQSLQPFQT